MTSEADGRLHTLQARLAKVGVQDSQKAAGQLDVVHELRDFAPFLDDLALAADPDLACATACQWFLLAPQRLREDWLLDAEFRSAWVLVSGASEAFSQFLVKHPEAAEVCVIGADANELFQRKPLVERMLAAVSAQWSSGRWIASADDESSWNALRIAYKREVVKIAALDLSGQWELEHVSQALSYLADAVLEAALAIAWRSVQPATPLSKLAVIALGKCGGRELNYVSDVDVIFVAEAADGAEGDFLAEATRVASRAMYICEVQTSEGNIWQVDASLRPEGKAGALVRTLDGYLSYFSRWAQTWEFQAQLKAREMAGDVELAQRYVDAILPLVWKAAERENFVADVQQMRQRVVDNIPLREAERELKLGIGGLRDIEFAVQLLQLVHGRADVMIRSSTTVAALQSLATWGYIAREDSATMEAAYRFERTLEHRIQMYRMRRTHLIPEEEIELRRLGRSIGLRNDPVQSLQSALSKTKRDARRLHEKLFYRPLLNAVARLDAADTRLSLEAATDRLRALGFVDPENSLRHLQALSAGVTRRAVIQRTLLPVMLQWFAETPTPDVGLLGFRKISESLGATPWYLRLLRDDSIVAERLALILCVSKYTTELLMRAPESVNILADDELLSPRTAEAIGQEMAAVARRADDVDAAIQAIRTVRQRELFRVAAADTLGLLKLEQVTVALSNIADATLQATLSAVMSAHFRDREPTLRLAIIGLGRLGGREMSYASDADACVVYESLADGAAADALAVVATVQAKLNQPAQDPPFELDLDLRPEGKNGPIARTIESYQAYYERWSLTWESQALLRARAVAGDDELGEKFIQIIDALRFPEHGLEESEVREIRRIKARVESERLPRGADPQLHVKLGPGGISDVEWCVQLLQLQHAHECSGLRTPSTLEALEAIEAAKLLSAEDVAVLREAWILASELRNGMMLTHGRASDSLPVALDHARLLAFVRGRTTMSGLIDTYRRGARRARRIMENVVYGVETSIP